MNNDDKTINLWFPNLFDFKGGIQVYLLDVLKVIVENLPEFKIQVYNKLDQGKKIENFCSYNNILFHFHGNVPNVLRTLIFTLSLLTSSLKKRPTLIVCGHINFAPVAYWVYRLTGTPYWIVVHGTDAWGIKDQIKQKALKTASKVISVSNYTRDRLLKEQKLDPNQISLLPVTFDASRFEIAPKPKLLLERYGLTLDQPTILTVARLSRSDGYKGYDQVIKALPQIRQQIPNVHYLIVGKGDDRPRIEQLIQSLNLQDYVTLAGFIPDHELVAHYNLCDVFAMPSKGEGFGIVYLEALACGKPTLGGNQDGAIDALCHGQLGALIDPDNIDVLAQTLIQILQGTYPNQIIYQPELLRQKVINIFGFAQFQQTLIELLKQQLTLTESLK
ncbi:glycosyltransferase [Halotia branconii]|uniref:Glycosyltransferase n=1 Tax=Halotia branconii CENA392 TaxID=1539056 RepID=A0AAJ6P7X0_9CYAN|nr:glycosyltransferase [Halotia branconii]WGV24071.1 glycosyltransferase [Halotia branconii CENA392]